MAHRPRRLDGSYALMVAGPGVPAGGLEGQFAKKNSDADYDIVWARVGFINLTGIPSDNDALTEVLLQKSDISHTHDTRYYKEDEVDTLLDGKSDVGHTHDDRYYTEAEIDALLAGLGGGGDALEWAPNWADDADVFIPAAEAMTVSQGNAAIGTGTIAFAKSTTAAPSTFSSTTLPASIEAGAWLKVSATGVVGFLATHLVRTA